MSYEVTIEINTGITQAVVEDVGEYTGNVSPMYRLAIPPVGLPSLSGMSCSDAAGHLTLALEYMTDEADKMQALPPERGSTWGLEKGRRGGRLWLWGSYEGAMEFLRRCRDACLRHPLATFCVLC